MLLDWEACVWAITIDSRALDLITYIIWATMPLTTTYHPFPPHMLSPFKITILFFSTHQNPKFFKDQAKILLYKKIS